MRFASPPLDASRDAIDSKARAIERLTRWAGVSAVYAPAPGDDEPGWTEIAWQLDRDRRGPAPPWRIG